MVRRSVIQVDVARIHERLQGLMRFRVELIGDGATKQLRVRVGGLKVASLGQAFQEVSGAKTHGVRLNLDAESA